MWVFIRGLTIVDMPPKKKPKIQYQLGGARKGASGPEVFVIPVVDGKPQLGGAFWDRAVNWVKRTAGKVANAAKPFIKPIHDVVKRSGVIGNTLSAVPGIGPVAGAVAKHYGYGVQAGGRIVKAGNAMQAGGAGRIVKKGNALRAAR